MSDTEISPATNTTLRLKEIDFLRGVAVILVLFRHHWTTNILQHAGWIGVDLFFVLSGFLVSGLLFAEYKKFGDIKPFYFLIRRGFKIYPLFYLSILITFFYMLASPANTLNYKGMIVAFGAEIFFLQNYLGSLWGHHWSLAVEEHFYFLLSALLFLLGKYKILGKQKMFLSIASIIFTACLALRILSNLLAPEADNFAQTHLRIDSLFAGVLIAHFYNFDKERLRNFYEKYRRMLVFLIFVPLTFVPFTDYLESAFIKTIGFTVLYISFGALLIIFLFSQNLGARLQKAFTPLIYSLVCTIGFYSYSIYLFHMYMIRYVVGDAYLEDTSDPSRKFTFNVLGSFLIYFAGSIFLGIVSSKLVELPLLKIRDRYFPRRSQTDLTQRL